MSRNGFPMSQYVKTSFFQQPQGKCGACEAEFLDPSPVLGLPMWPSGKESARQCRRCRFDPWVGKNPGGGNGNPFQSSCLENPMDRGAWLLQSGGLKKSGATEHALTHTQEGNGNQPSSVTETGLNYRLLWLGS